MEYDRGRLTWLRMKSGLNNDWQTFCETTRCESCGGPVRVAIKPFATDSALREGDMRKQLVFKALCALHETQAAAKAGRVPPSFGLRFALAYLYAVGKRNREYFDREPYVEFWRVATTGDAANTSPGHDSAAYGRSMLLQTCVNGIARAAGLEMTPEVMAALGKATGRLA